jgi:hypothetical protein
MNIILDLFKLADIFDKDKKYLMDIGDPLKMTHISELQTMQSKALVAMFHHWRDTESHDCSEETYYKIRDQFNSQISGEYKITAEWGEKLCKLSDFVDIEEKCLEEVKKEDFAEFITGYDPEHINIISDEARTKADEFFKNKTKPSENFKKKTLIGKDFYHFNGFAESKKKNKDKQK